MSRPASATETAGAAQIEQKIVVGELFQTEPLQYSLLSAYIPIWIANKICDLGTLDQYCAVRIEGEM